MYLRDTVILLSIFLLTSCSSENDDDKENILNNTTHEIAEKGVAAIQTPLDKARTVATVTEEHNRLIQKQVKEQSGEE
jgi:PBP1b-binding outer membrane lipoprotein LpoB